VITQSAGAMVLASSAVDQHAVLVQSNDIDARPLQFWRNGPFSSRS